MFIQINACMVLHLHVKYLYHYYAFSDQVIQYAITLFGRPIGRDPYVYKLLAVMFGKQ